MFGEGIGVSEGVVSGVVEPDIVLSQDGGHFHLRRGAGQFGGLAERQLPAAIEIDRQRLAKEVIQLFLAHSGPTTRRRSRSAASQWPPPACSSRTRRGS